MTQSEQNPNYWDYTEDTTEDIGSQTPQEKLTDPELLRGIGYITTKSTPAQQNIIDAEVASCLRCIASRHPGDYEDTSVPGSAIAACLQITPQKASAAVKRLSYTDKPPVTRRQRGLPFRLTAYATTLETSETPKNCQNNSAVPLSETYLGQVAVRKTRQAEKLIAVCTEDLTDPSRKEQIAHNIRQLMQLNFVGLKRSRVQSAPAVAGYSERGSWVHLSIGGGLIKETVPMQKALLYHFGVDHLIYGDPVDTDELRDELGMLPYDSLDALAQLLLFRLGIDRDLAKTPGN